MSDEQNVAVNTEINTDTKGQNKPVKQWPNIIFSFNDNQYVLNFFKVITRQFPDVNVPIENIDLNVHAKLVSDKIPVYLFDGDRNIRFIYDDQQKYYPVTGLDTIKRILKDYNSSKQCIEALGGDIKGPLTISAKVYHINSLKKIAVATPSKPISAQDAISKLTQNSRFHINQQKKDKHESRDEHEVATT